MLAGVTKTRKTQIANPVAFTSGDQEMPTANTNSKKPLIITIGRRADIVEGNIAIISSVFTKCPTAVNTNTAAIPIRAAFG